MRECGPHGKSTSEVKVVFEHFGETASSTWTMFTVETERQIERLHHQHTEMALGIKAISAALSALDEETKRSEEHIERSLDEVIFKLKNRKLTLLGEVRSIWRRKKKILSEQLSTLKTRQRRLADFKQDHDRLVLGESHGMDEVERKQSMESTAMQLLDALPATKPMVSAKVEVEGLDDVESVVTTQSIAGLGRVDSCNVPYPPIMEIQEIYASSAKVHSLCGFHDLSDLSTTSSV